MQKNLYKIRLTTFILIKFKSNTILEVISSKQKNKTILSAPQLRLFSYL